MKSIIKAAEHIAYDNGAINRHNSESAVLTNMVFWACKEHNVKVLVETEQFLSSLSDKDMEELCCGEGTVEAPEFVSNVLNTMFDHC